MNGSDTPSNRPTLRLSSPALAGDDYVDVHSLVTVHRSGAIQSRAYQYLETELSRLCTARDFSRAYENLSGVSAILEGSTKCRSPYIMTQLALLSRLERLAPFTHERRLVGEIMRLLRSKVKDEAVCAEIESALISLLKDRKA